MSWKIDPTSHILGSILSSSHLVKPSGSHLKTFTYHHPSVASHKSCLDRIYINYDVPRLCGYAQHCSISDHYLVGLFLTRQISVGPRQSLHQVNKWIFNSESDLEFDRVRLQDRIDQLRERKVFLCSVKDDLD